MEILNALQETDLEGAESLGADEGPAQAREIDVDQIEQRATDRVLQRLAQMAETAGTPAKDTHLAKTLKNLQERGVSAEAIGNWLELQEAAERDKAEGSRRENIKQAAVNYEQHCWSSVFEALETVGEGVPLIKNAKQGLKQDLAGELKELVWNDKRFLDVQKAYQSGQPLPKARLKEAAAIVADSFCKEHGIEKPTGQIDLRSSKPAKGGEPAANFDPNGLPKELRAIYDINMNYFKDPKKAMQRVREASR
ncbi:MAG: hypothetical protein JSS82_15550 [Bacteroidetes bacterium]|nr:hypothetical protein [Bacteroidota bacterium]